MSINTHIIRHSNHALDFTGIWWGTRASTKYSAKLHFVGWLNSCSRQQTGVVEIPMCLVLITKSVVELRTKQVAAKLCY